MKTYSTKISNKKYPEFKDKYALILGGSSGLGLASAKKLAAEGLNLIIVHRDRKSNLQQFQMEVEEMKDNGIEVTHYNQDALKNEVMKEIIAEIPKNTIKLLLHSIAKGTLKPMISENSSVLSVEDLSITINAMALSWYNWTQALINNSCFSEEARNIAFTSEGNKRVLPNYGAVSAAKATLEALMGNMAVEFAPKDLRTNCIQAGITETESFKMIPESGKIAEHAKNRNPFKKLTSPQDIANVVFLMCLQESSWINGTIIKVDGGESLS